MEQSGPIAPPRVSMSPLIFHPPPPLEEKSHGSAPVTSRKILTVQVANNKCYFNNLSFRT